MARHPGKPSGVNKSSGTGIPTVINDEKAERDEQLTEMYTDDDEKISDGVRSAHPNRNTDKVAPTNAHGYKNRKKSADD